MWILSHWIAETNDYVCDDFVTSQLHNHRSYAVRLSDLALHYQGGLPDILGVSIVSVHTSLTRRIKRIMDRSQRNSFRVSLSNMCIVFFLGSVALLTSGFVNFRGTIRQVYGAEQIWMKRNAGAGGRPLISPLPSGTSGIPERPASPGRESISAETFGKHAPHRERHTRKSKPDRNSLSVSISDLASLPAETEKVDTIEKSADPLRPEWNEGAVSESVPPGNLLSHLTMPEMNASDMHSPAGFNPKERALFPQNVSETAPANGKTGAGALEVETYDYGFGIVPYRAESPDLRTPGKVDVISQWDKKPYDYSDDLTLKDELDWYLSRGQKYPMLSPDGSFIAFTDWSGCGIWMLPLNSNDPSLVFTDTKVLKSEKFGFVYEIRGQHKQTLCFTPDGKEITFRDELYDESRGSRAIIDDSGHLRSTSGYIPVIRRVNWKTGEGRTVVEEAWNGCWHPDGRYFIYTKTRSTAIGEQRSGDVAKASIMVLDTFTGTERLLVDQAHSPCITPNGELIVFVENSWDNPQLYTIPFHGGEAKRLTSEGYWHQPVCSPDGKWVMGLIYNSMLPTEKDTWFRAINFENSAIKDIYPPGDFVFATVGNFSPAGTQFCYQLLTTWESDEYDKYDCHLYVENFYGFKPEMKTNTDTSGPREFAIKGNFPNPFNMNTTIDFAVDKDGIVSVEIFNIMGQRVRTLVNGHRAAGMHTVLWDGTSDKKQRMASGTYIARLVMGSRIKTHLMSLVK
jgi:Tol biopolymer transport system component